MGAEKKDHAKVHGLERPIIRARRSLSEIREDVGVSQAQLAAAAGVPKSAIANVEADRQKVSARDGAEIYMAIAQIATPQSPVYLEATEEAAKLIAFQEENCRIARIGIKRQRESLEKKATEISRTEADLESKKARLDELCRRSKK